MKSIIKWICSIVGAVLVGAVGSGVWERIISPLFSSVMRLVAEYYSNISSGYANDIYIIAVRGTTDIYAAKVNYMIVFVVSVALLLMGTYDSIERFMERRGIIMFHRKSMKIYCTFTGIVLLVLVIINTSKANAAIEIRDASFRSFEILRPYVDEKEYYNFRAMFYSIKKKHDFDQFASALAAHKSLKGVELPVFSYAHDSSSKF